VVESLPRSAHRGAMLVPSGLRRLDWNCLQATPDGLALAPGGTAVPRTSRREPGADCERSRLGLRENGSHGLPVAPKGAPRGGQVGGRSPKATGTFSGTVTAWIRGQRRCGRSCRPRPSPGISESRTESLGARCRPKGLLGGSAVGAFFEAAWGGFGVRPAVRALGESEFGPKGLPVAVFVARLGLGSSGRGRGCRGSDGSEGSPNLGLPVRSALRCPGAARGGRLAVPSRGASGGLPSSAGEPADFWTRGSRAGRSGSEEGGVGSQAARRRGGGE